MRCGAVLGMAPLGLDGPGRAHLNGKHLAAGHVAADAKKPRVDVVPMLEGRWLV